MPKFNYRQSVLDNGLKVILYKNTNIPSVILNVSFKVGSKDEKPGEKGIAHLLEHLLFTGLYGIEKRSYDEILGKLGGDSNAYTSYDMTSYYISVPSAVLEYAVRLDSMRLKNLDISEENIKTQKKVVLEEKSQVYDNVPYGSLEFESSTRLFKNTPYEIPVIGTEKDINGLSYEDIHRFYSKYYTAGNSVLTVCGNFDENKIESLLNKYYTSIKSGGELNQPPAFGENGFNPEKIEIEDRINLPAIFFNFRTTAFGTKEYYASKFVSGILTGGDSSELRKELIHNNHLCHEADSSGISFECAGLFSIDVYLNEGTSVSQVEEIIRKSLNKIAVGDFSERDVIKIKNKIELSYHTSLQTNLSVADNLSFFQIITGNPERINYEYENAIAITKDDIISYTKNYLNNEKMLMLIYIPEDNQ